MSQGIKSLLTGKPLLLLAAVAAILNGALWAIVVLTFPRDAPAAVLHYSVGVGIDFIGEGSQVMALPGIGLAILLVDVILAAIVKGTNTISSWIFISSAVLAQVLLLIAYGHIFSLNL